MFKNYLKTAWRNLVKNKFYTLINIGGLAVGLCIGILILLWIQDEYSFDSFNTKEKNIYRLENMAGTGSSRQLWTATASAIGDMAKKTIPAVKDAVRISYNGYYGLYKYGDKVFTEPDTFFADASLFSIFDYKIIEGNAKNPFSQYNSVVINESTAKKYFGNTDAIGKTISIDDKLNIIVSAVAKDFPKNSSIQGNMFFSMDLLARNMYTDNTEGRNLSNDFLQYNYQTFLLLNPGTDLNSLAVKLRQLHLSVKSDDTDVGYLLQPLADMHLRNADGSDRGLSTVHMFALVALLILIIACINYINLSTARSMLRAKEVSLRKIIGAERMQLFMQFIIETALLFVCAIIIALVMVYVLVPYFNQVSGKDVQINFADYHLWQVIGLTIIGTLIISSIYPAMLLSSFKPINALKGKISAGISDALFRRILVVIQFTFSVILIAGTPVIGKQLNYIRTSQLGYDKDHVLAFNMINMSAHLDAIKDDLSKDPAILNVTNSSGSIVDYGGQTGDNSWDGKLIGETVMMSPMRIDTNFISFFQLQMAGGDNFSGSLADSTHFILNEAAVRQRV